MTSSRKTQESVQIKDNILNASFVACADVITMLESKVNDKTCNITNWITQILANEYYDAKNHNVTIKMVVDGQPIMTTFDSEYMPAVSHGSGQASSYHAWLKHADFTDKPHEILKLFSYLSAWLLSGKPLAIVNQGRALILDSMIKTLNVSFVELTIKNLSFGGNPEKTARDYTISLDDLKLMIAFQVARAKNLLALKNSTGHDTRPHVDNSKIKKNPVTTFKV